MSFFIRFSIWIVVSSIIYNLQIVVYSIKTTTFHNINDTKIDFDKYKPNFTTDSLKPERRIFNGKQVKSMENFPYMAYLLRITTSPYNATHSLRNVETCGATILDRTHVLTAAHCLKACSCNYSVDDSQCTSCEVRGPHDYVIFVGSTVPNNSNSQLFVKRIFIHPGHRYVSNEYWCIHRQDIAVLELSYPMNFTRDVQPIKLPEAVELEHDDLDRTMTTEMANAKYITDRTCSIVGWGSTSQNIETIFMQEKLMVAEVPLINMKRCIRELIKSEYIQGEASRKSVCEDTNICTKALVRSMSGICHGDSGGPLVCAGVQLGVSSWTLHGCVGAHIPNMFTRVDININWINDILSSKSVY